MKQCKSLSVCSAAMVFLLFVRCMAPTGGGTETGNARITAMLYNPGGTPAANAKVCFYRHDEDPRPGQGSGAVDSTTTDANGNYTAKLDSGTYNILSSGDSGLAFQDSIKVIKGDTTHPPADTLKAPGTLRGVVQLQPGDDPRTVFILFMGTHTFIMPDDSLGDFATAAMAEGKYRVRILTTIPNYRVLDTSLSIKGGKDSVLKDTIILPYIAPHNLNAYVNDSTKSITLTWSVPIGIQFAGYYIYRSYQPIAGYDRISNLLKDTIYIDSSFIPSDSGKTIYYRATGLLPTATESPYSELLSVYISFKSDSVNDLPTH